MEQESSAALTTETHAQDGQETRIAGRKRESTPYRLPSKVVPSKASRLYSYTSPPELTESFEEDQHCGSSEEKGDDQEDNVFARSYETISHIMCPTCGEDIDSGEFLKNNKCFCSDECMRRENLSSFSENSPITYSDIEAERTKIELEFKDLITQYASDMLQEKTDRVNQLEEQNQQLTVSLDQKVSEKEELNAQIVELQGELDQTKSICKELEDAKGKLEVKLSVERSMKIQAINKLAEVLNTKEFQLKESKKNVPSSDLAEKEKENKGSQNKLAWTSEKSSTAQLTSPLESNSGCCSFLPRI